MLKQLFALPERDCLIFAPNEVHIWSISTHALAAYLNEFALILSLAEQTKAANFVFANDRQRFILARGLLRLLLSQYLQIKPQQISFALTKHGKPQIANYSSIPIQFNLSHSHDMILYSFAKDISLGIDIEYRHTGINILGIAKRFFAGAEVEYLQQLERTEQFTAFYKIWTQKEAVTKMLGTGLYHSLNSINVLEPSKDYFLTELRIVEGYTHQYDDDF